MNHEEFRAKHPLGINETLAVMRREQEQSQPHKMYGRKSSPPPVRKWLTAQELVDRHDERRPYKQLEGRRWPAGKKYPRDPKMPWNQKGVIDPDPEAKKREALMEQLAQIELPSDAKRLFVTYSYDAKSTDGIFAVEDITEGVKSDAKLEAATLRHFQVRMLKGILEDVAPIGNVVIFSDDLSLVEHFHPLRWKFYQENDWKETSGDRLHFRILYEDIDRAMAGRVVVVTFPETPPELEKESSKQEGLRP